MKNNKSAPLQALVAYSVISLTAAFMLFAGLDGQARIELKFGLDGCSLVLDSRSQSNQSN
jgi:hypothetical protein